MSLFRLAGLASLWLALSPLARAEQPANLVSTLTEPELDEVLSLLRTKSTISATLSEIDLKRATVQGLLDRLGQRGALLAAPTPSAGETSAFRAEVIDGRIGYLRLGSLTAHNLEELDKALAAFPEKTVTAEVLDLRATPAGVDFEQVSALCQRWAPRGQPLFFVDRREEPKTQLFSSKGEPVHRPMLLVLTGAENSGSAEIAAAVLRGVDRALVIGRKTKGDVGEFVEKALGSGKVLRYPVGEVRLPWSEWLGAGVWPDLPVEVPAGETAQVLKVELEKGVAAALIESERPRLNEAALVAGKTPELDAMEAAQRLHEPVKSSPRDAVLQRAVDVVTSLAVFGKGK